MANEFANPEALPNCVVEEKWHADTVVLGCSGVVDMLTAPQLQQSLASALVKLPASVVVDLSKVDFLASHGIRVLIEAHDQITPGAGFAVVADGPATGRPLKLIGVADMLNTHATLDSALAWLGSRKG